MQECAFFHFSQERYEAAFEFAAGSLKNPIPAEQIAEYIKVLFPLYRYRISSYNVSEFLEIFGKNGTRSKELVWADIRKVLREQKSQVPVDDSIFLGTVLNPTSWLVSNWMRLLKAVALYHFIMVPVRISFVPWERMVDSEALGTDLIADIITVLNIPILGNTAYMGSKATWITDTSKIFRRINIGYIIAAVPVDW